MRFVRDATLDGLVTHDGETGSVYAAVTLRAADGSLRAFVLTWNTHQAKGYAAARGSADGRPLLLVLPRALSGAQIRPSSRTASRSSASSAALASMRAREKSSISSPCTISQRAAGAARPGTTR